MNPLMRIETCDSDHSPESQPLLLEVTDAGHLTMQYQGLLRQIVPVLQSPEQFPEAYRSALVHKISLSLAVLPDEENEQAYEPDGILNEEEEEPW